MRLDVLRRLTRWELPHSPSGGNSNSPETPELVLKQVAAHQFNDGVETGAVHLSTAALEGIVTSSFTNPIEVI